MSSRRSRKEEKGQVAYLIIKPGKPSQLSPPPPPPASKDNENSISMFKFAFLLVLALAVACSVFGSSRAAPAKSSSCQNDNECAEGQYCRQKYGSASCTPCLDCGSYNRKPGIGQCVKTRTECGECLPGFVQLGNQCSRNAQDITTSKSTNSVLYATPQDLTRSTYSNSGYVPPNKPSSADAGLRNSIFEVKNVGNINHTGKFPSDHQLVPHGHPIWLLIAVSAILSVVMVTGLVMMYCRRPLVVQAGPRHKDEEMELQPMSTGSSPQSPGGGDQAPTADLSPSAPPVEYVQKPPAYWSGGDENAGRAPNEYNSPKLTGKIRVVTRSPPSYWSGGVEYARHCTWNKGHKLMGSDLPVTQAGGIERIVPENYQQANPFYLGHAASGPEAQAFLAHDNLDQEGLYDDGPDDVLDLLENAINPPAPVQLPAQLVPDEFDLENPEAAAAGNNLHEESMDLGAVPLADDEMDIDNDEVFIEFRADVVAVIPADGQPNDPANENVHDEENGNDSGDAVVPTSSPTFPRTLPVDHENNPGDDNNDNMNGQNRLNVNQPPAEIAAQFHNQFNIQLVNPDNWMEMAGNEEQQS